MHKSKEMSTRRSVIAKCVSHGLNRDFWREITKLESKNKTLPSAVDGFTDDGDIANSFAQKYSTLYQSVPTSHQEIADMRRQTYCLTKRPIVMKITSMLRTLRNLYCVYDMVSPMEYVARIQIISYTVVLNNSTLPPFLLYPRLIQYIYIVRVEAYNKVKINSDITFCYSRSCEISGN